MAARDASTVGIRCCAGEPNYFGREYMADAVDGTDMPVMDASNGSSSHDQVLNALVDSRRRRILRYLQDRSEVVTDRELARRMAALDAEPGRSASPRAIRGVRQELRHVKLPELTDAGLIDWDRSAGTVATTDHPVFDEGVLETLTAGDDWDAVIDCLADDRRRAVLDVVDGADGEVGRRDVACELLERQSPDTPSYSDLREVLRSLHHVHLPKLDEAGFVTYDVESATVAATDDPRYALVRDLL